MGLFNFSFKPQMASHNRPIRKEHVWFPKGPGFKCCLCGAITLTPPGRPEPADWEPDHYEPLTPEERALCRNPKVVQHG